MTETNVGGVPFQVKNIDWAIPASLVSRAKLEFVPGMRSDSGKPDNWLCYYLYVLNVKRKLYIDQST